MSAKLYTEPKDDSHKSFSFMTYNVDQAMREENVEATKWMKRKDRVAALIKDVGADIVCLQEMRKLKEVISVNKFLAEFDDYEFVVGYRNASSLAFGQAILWNRKRFDILRTVKRWLSDTPYVPSDTWSAITAGTTGFGYLVLCAQFVPVATDHEDKAEGEPVSKFVNNGQPFWVFNVHFGLDEDVKTKSCYKLLEIVHEVANDQPAIIAGDFNFFPDKNADFQRAIMTSVYDDAGKGAKTLSGKHVEGTFVGYDHDPFKADLGNMMSRLDHVFVSHNTVAHSDPVLYTRTMLSTKEEEVENEFTTRNYPSDHLPLLVKLRIE